MSQPRLTMAQQIARAASVDQFKRTGHAPSSVTVILKDDTLVITLHEALTPAERKIASDPAGAAQVQDFHRKLFSSTVDVLKAEIKRITGVGVSEATTELDSKIGVMVNALAKGRMVQIFLLENKMTPEQFGEA